MRRLVNALADWADRIKHRRRWPVSLQIEMMRIQMQEDARWMASDPKASALCSRYLDMLSDDWMCRPVANVAQFRDSIGCNPHKKNTSNET